MTAAEKRRELAALMDELVVHAPAVHYGQHRPMRSTSIKTPAGLAYRLGLKAGLTMDCSETVTLICRLAGLKDPNGWAYDGEGNSGQMWAHLPHFSDPADAFVGAICTFGYHGRRHVAMVRRRGTDPIMFSHGGEPGPNLIRLSWLAAAIEPPHQLLSIAGLLL
jgi:hypothetical protein